MSVRVRVSVCVVAALVLALAGCVPKIKSPFGSGTEAEQTAPASASDDQIVVLAEDETVYSPIDVAPAPGAKPGSEAVEPEAGETIVAQAEGTDTAEGAAPASGTDAAVAALPLPGAAPQPQGLPGDNAPVPHIYLSLQSQGSGRPVSAIFAIDASRDATPSDDPAIRLTPEDGLCNPQSMTSYNFPEADADRPAVTDADRERGLTAAVLPSVMAVVVTERMLEAGLAGTKEDTRAMNICTRKLWQQLVSAGNLPPAGQ